MANRLRLASAVRPGHRTQPLRALLGAALIGGQAALVASVAAEDTLSLRERIGVVEDRNVLANPGWFVWGGSAIRGSDGRYHMFYSRWRGRFGDWKRGSEIAYAVSDRADGPYEYVKTVLTGSGDPARWDYINAHNPHVKKFGKSYYLYYIATQPPEGEVTNRTLLDSQSIGVLRFESFDQVRNGDLTPPPECVMRPDNQRMFRRTVNPSVTRGHDGRYYMAFKSTAKEDGFVHWIARAEHPEGPFHLLGKMLDRDLGAEDPYLWYDANRERYYAIVKEWGRGKLAPQHGALALITSTDARDWSPAANPLVLLRKLRRPDGTAHAVGYTDRPQLIFGADESVVTLCVACSGLPGRERTFNVQLPIAPIELAPE